MCCSSVGDWFLLYLLFENMEKAHNLKLLIEVFDNHLSVPAAIEDDSSSDSGDELADINPADYFLLNLNLNFNLKLKFALNNINSPSIV